jgi:hypothetical protein
MKALIQHLSAIALLSACMGSALADRSEGRNERRERPDRQAAERFEQERSGRPQEGRSGGQEEGEHRHPRLSPEERRALRQQINEAGHDIYQPKR